MTHSKTHYRFANWLNDPRVLNHPEEFLGPNWKEVLNFWLYIGTLSREQFRIANSSYWALHMEVRNSLRDLAWSAPCGVTSRDITNKVFNAAHSFPVGIATLELIGSHRILGQGKSLVVVSLLLNS